MGKLQTFYLIVVSKTLSLIGSHMTSIGVGLWLFQRASVTTPLLLAAFFAELPGMLGSSLVGVLVDRCERRQVLILADAGQAVGTILLLASTGLMVRGGCERRPYKARREANLSPGRATRPRKETS